jgi:hypothetical protein
VDANDDAVSRLREQVRVRLDALAAASGEERARTAAALAEIGIWRRRRTHPRGTLWAAAPNELPDPDRLPELIAALEERDATAQAQIASALGEWSDATAVAPLLDLVTRTRDETVALHGIEALRTIGGPAAVAGLLDVARDSDRETLARVALFALQELLFADRTDDGDAPIVMREPPVEFVAVFERTFDTLMRALADLESRSPHMRVRSQARELRALATRPPRVERAGALSADRLGALSDELARIPSTPAGTHLSPDERLACATENLASVDVVRISAHLESCDACRDDVDGLAQAIRPWQGESGAARIASIVAHRDANLAAEGKKKLAALIDIRAWEASRPRGDRASAAPLMEERGRELAAAADDRIRLTLVPTGDLDEGCTLFVEEQEREGRWRTEFRCQVIGGLEFDEILWRLRFAPEDEERRLSLDAEQAQALLGEYGKKDWNSLLDDLIPHRFGRLAGTDVLTTFRDGRLPGWPIGYALIVKAHDE